MRPSRSAALSLVALPAFLGGCTCSSEPVIEGKVVDLWGHPVAGAVIEVQGIDEPYTTAFDGTFETVMVPEASLRLRGEGYIPREVTLTPDDLEVTYRQPIELIPEPPKPGFYLVGPEDYLPLQPQPVTRVGTDLNAWQGIRTSGDTLMPAGPVRIIFHTPMKLDQIARLQIELHALKFIEERQMGTIQGETGVRVNLWVSDGKVDLTREPLGNRANYLYRADGLEPGTYALSTLQLLDARNPEAFDKTPPQVRTVHPFTLQ